MYKCRECGKTWEKTLEEDISLLIQKGLGREIKTFCPTCREKLEKELWSKENV